MPFQVQVDSVVGLPNGVLIRQFGVQSLEIARQKKVLGGQWKKIDLPAEAEPLVPVKS